VFGLETSGLGFMKPFAKEVLWDFVDFYNKSMVITMAVLLAPKGVQFNLHGEMGFFFKGIQPLVAHVQRARGKGPQGFNTPCPDWESPPKLQKITHMG
jgi:hypothetical protein